MKRYEYKLVRFSSNWIDDLNREGLDGWRFIGRSDQGYLLEREIEVDPWTDEEERHARARAEWEEAITRSVQEQEAWAETLANPPF
jgi:hypothetical protein